MAHASFVAKSGKRLWAGGFDALAVSAIFLTIAAAAEGLGADLSRWSVFGLIYFLYNVVPLLFREGRTLGKTAVDICVVSAAGRPLTVTEAIVRAAARSWPFFLLDAGIARTFDWYLGFSLAVPVGTLSLASLILAETTLLDRSSTRQTIADRLAGSLVVNLPPIQPHRAPAIPMYSTTDGEFGIPPVRPAASDEDWKKRSNSAAENMRTLLTILALVALTGCSQKEWIQKFSSPKDQATARSYIDRLRARNYDEIEKAIDPSVRTPGIRETLVKMASLIPNQKPTSVKVVGAQSFSSADAKTVNTTFEYSFGDKWLLANVAVRERQGVRTIVGFQVKPIPRSLEAQNRFTLAGKSVIQYSVLIAAIAAVLLTAYSLVVCVRTKLPRRKWLWVLFIVVGFGKLGVNWTTGEWGIAPLSVQLFSASAAAQFYGPWIIAVSLPLGAILFLFFKRPALEQALRANSTAELDARKDDARGSP